MRIEVSLTKYYRASNLIFSPGFLSNLILYFYMRLITRLISPPSRRSYVREKLHIHNFSAFCSRSLFRGVLDSVKLNGLKFRTTPFASLNLSTIHEPIETHALTKILRPRLFIDVGAHIGRYSLLMARTSERVICLEPSPEAYQILLINISLNRLKNVVPLNLAAWDADDEVISFHLERSVGGRSSAVRKPENSCDTVKARTITLDTVTKGFGVSSNDLVIKIDAELAETHVLRGAQRTLKELRPILMVEIFRRNLEWCRGFFENLNYEVIGPINNYPYADNYFCIPEEKFDETKVRELVAYLRDAKVPLSSPR
ncbi:MAG: FkbM family methyltransferase [Aigarchaeota archaeon]|nr:FkbM family methyltransferase [Aigarchaeota archaeon]MDW8092390.1 FkbM family methyltransferase [Nitrososphaerota archaeon]